MAFWDQKWGNMREAFWDSIMKSKLPGSGDEAKGSSEQEEFRKQ